MLATLASDQPGIGYARGEDLDAGAAEDIGSAANAAGFVRAAGTVSRNLCDDGVERKRLA